jgi:hypothetical protein
MNRGSRITGVALRDIDSGSFTGTRGREWAGELHLGYPGFVAIQEPGIPDGLITVLALPERLCQLEVPRVRPDRFIGCRSTSAVDDPLAVLTAGLQKILAVNELGARR